MAKIDKSLYTKSEWIALKEDRRKQKALVRQKKYFKEELVDSPKPITLLSNKVSFVIGNGTSRKTINLETLKGLGKIYACNAVYRDFSPHYLIAVDQKMILEINKSGYQNKNEVWTNPNRAYDNLKNFNFFKPSKGWSSGPTALWLASKHSYNKIYILGFDFKGLKNGSKFNNIYADTKNYKKSTDGATFFGNWMRQTISVIKENKDIKYIHVCGNESYSSEDLEKIDNYSKIQVKDFKLLFNA